MTEMPPEIAKALVAFQSKNESMNLDKRGNRSQYASVGSMMTLVKKAAQEFGLGICFPTKRIDGEFCISPVIVHSSGVSWQSDDLAWPIIVDDMTNSQKLGSAVSYGRRYLMQSILGLAAGIAELDDDDDDDGVTNGLLDDVPHDFDWDGWANEALIAVRDLDQAALTQWDQDNSKIIQQAESKRPDLYDTVGRAYIEKMEGYKNGRETNIQEQ